MSCQDITLEDGATLNLSSGSITDCRHFTIESGATLNGGTGNLTLNGTWTNNGTTLIDSSNVSFLGGCGLTNDVKGSSDSDGDGRSDGVEGFGDIDSDGIQNFIDKDCVLTVNMIGTGFGTVTVNPTEIDCGSDCYMYAHATVVTLSATPDAVSSFGGWSGSGCSGLVDCIITVDNIKTVYAHFEGPPGDSDNDGLADIVEQGPDQDDPYYDGNGDGIPDWQQDNTTSFHTYAEGGTCYITLAAPNGQGIVYPQSLRAFDVPPPSGVSFPCGLFTFEVEGVEVGGGTTVTIHLGGDTPPSYYKYGKTPDNPLDHWYEFLYDGRTGAERVDNTIVLHFVDGERGDHDLEANGEITDPGGPAAIDSHNVLYFPHIDISGDNQTELGIISGEDYPVSGSISYYREDGNRITMTEFTLPPKGKRTIPANGIRSNAASAVVMADGNLTGYTRYVSSESKRCSWPAVRKLNESIAIPYCITGEDWRTGLGLFNPNESEVTVSIRLESGNSLDFSLGARGHKFLWLDTGESGAEITASGNIAAVEMFESLASGGDMAAVLLETRYISSLHVPAILNGQDTFTGVGICSGNWGGTLKVLDYRPGGEVEEISLGTLSSRCRTTIDLSSACSSSSMCASIINDTGNVTPSGTLYAPCQGLLSYGYDTTSKLGSVKLNGLRFKSGFLGVVTADVSPTCALMNPADENAAVSVTARKADGTVLASTALEIPAGANAIGMVKDLFGGSLPEGATHILLESDLMLYGLEGITADGRLEVLPVLTVE
jgi:hypothetical protein